MKPMLRGVFLLVAALALSGCLVTDKPLPPNELPAADSPYMGFWQSPWPAMLTRETLNVSYVPGKAFYVAVRGRGKYMGLSNEGVPVEIQETMSYEAYPSRVGNRTFFSIHSTKNDSLSFAIVEAVLEDGGKRLILREPTDEAVERAMDEKKLAYRIQEDSKLATSEPEAVAAWLLTLGEDDFKIHETFERWPAPVDDLKRAIEK